MYYVSLCKLCAIVIKFVVCSWFRSDFGVFASKVDSQKSPGAKWVALVMSPK